MICAIKKKVKEQGKKRQTASQWHTDIHSGESSDISRDKKCTAEEDIVTLPPDVLSDLKAFRADKVLLKHLKAEVSQIRKSVRKARTASKLDPPDHKKTD